MSNTKNVTNKRIAELEREAKSWIATKSEEYRKVCKLTNNKPSKNTANLMEQHDSELGSLVYEADDIKEETYGIEDEQIERVDAIIDALTVASGVGCGVRRQNNNEEAQQKMNTLAYIQKMRKRTKRANRSVKKLRKKSRKAK